MSECFSLVHQPSGGAIATVWRADGWWEKGWGVMGRPSLPPGQGLWLPGVSSVHTLFVRFPLDLLFLDADFRTIRAASGVRPWLPLVMASGARHTLELGAGTLAGFAAKIGDRWVLR